MQTLASALLLSCCFLADHSQYVEGDAETEQIRSTWDDPIQFVTKAKDQCSLTVTGKGDLTKLRISCQSRNRSYWCDYQGKPHVCQPFNKNPRHFFTQIMWELRKLRNACQGPSILTAFMCKKASEEAQMVFVTSSSPDDLQPAWVRPDSMHIPTTRHEEEEQIRPNGGRQKPSRSSSKSQPTKYQPGRPGEQGKAVASKPGAKTTRRSKVVKPKTTPPPPPPSTSPAPTSKAKSLAQQHCWPSLQAACAFVIGWFTN